MSTEAIEQPVRRVNRRESLSSAVILALGLAWFLSSPWARLSLPAFFVCLGLPLAASLWVLRLPFPPRRRDLEAYVLMVLPILLQASLLFFLTEFRIHLWIYLVGLSTFPLFYLLLISLSALEKYRLLPQHVGRVILNLLTLLAGALGYVFIFQANFGLIPSLIFVTVFATLLFGQGVFWWSNANVAYTVFYALLAGLILMLSYGIIRLWPTGALMSGFVMLDIQYMLMGLLQSYLKKNLTRSMIMEYASVGLIAFVLLMAQINWAGTAITFN